MKNAIELITENIEEYPEFEYYIKPIIEKAEKNLPNQPDICIEICKALFEGVSKSIIEKLVKPASQEDIKKLEMGPLVKKAAKLLKENDNVIEEDFITRSVSLAYALATLRNERGDISHGRAVPKHKKSNVRLAYLSYQMTEGIVSYMLDSFFRISKKLKDEKARKPTVTEDILDLEQVKYENNMEFNNLLDTDKPWDDKLSYSKALYELYYEDYLIRLNDYKDSNEEIKNDQNSI